MPRADVTRFLGRSCLGVSDRRRYGKTGLLAAAALVSAATLVMAQNGNPSQRPTVERRQETTAAKPLPPGQRRLPGSGPSHEGAFGTGGPHGSHPIGPSVATVTRTTHGGMRTQRSLVS